MDVVVDGVAVVDRVYWSPCCKVLVVGKQWEGICRVVRSWSWISMWEGVCGVVRCWSWISMWEGVIGLGFRARGVSVRCSPDWPESLLDTQLPDSDL
eukprot:1395541-Amorphochlora_amoeboformis.AAC.1